MRYIYIWGGGGGNYYIAILPGGNLLYSHFPAYPGKGGKWLYNTGIIIIPSIGSLLPQ